ncbi:leucyl aminopeptidase [Maribius pontilimi]|uniref:Probable cytosol aminopeptidase n=1 Tax=Palleronia pontilimi TaxID=1964209 RepID=A0A934MBP2_9RHOB|nr:leucyl aminopeptidase [Palleronia pontilimi]MBJ3761715.1 leucyl aminopeptidase [Palleronia pontilimi]
MTRPATLKIVAMDLDALADAEGSVAVLMGEDGALGAPAKRVNKLAKGAVARFAESKSAAKMKPGDAKAIAWPAGMAAENVLVARLDRKSDPDTARRAGVALARQAAGDLTIVAGNHRDAEALALGALLRGYNYTDQKSKVDDETGPGEHTLTLMVADPDALSQGAEALGAVAEGVFFTRDLVNAPANVLTTTAFADQLVALERYGLEVEVLEQDKLAELGMGALLAVGQGSDSPSKVVVMQWKGGGSEAPFALIGKGVVFDTGGISLKPAGGMEDMTMDMGGGGVVSGVMKTLALRKAKANVVGLVGLVENMPGPNATRPGDVVTSMKGDTIEVINTDAEGRLVLCDVMWYAQERFKPSGMIDLATLTGAIIIALGHDNAGVFSNDDGLCEAFLKAARAEDEGAWRMPLGDPYAKQLDSNIADVKNVGGRPAGSITAAEFLHRFVQDDVPWCHLDIAGVASTKADSPYAPKGASGWGVRALDRLIRDTLEK